MRIEISLESAPRPSLECSGNIITCLQTFWSLETQNSCVKFVRSVPNSYEVMSKKRFWGEFHWSHSYHWWFESVFGAEFSRSPLWGAVTFDWLDESFFGQLKWGHNRCLTFECATQIKNRMISSCFRLSFFPVGEKNASECVEILLLSLIIINCFCLPSHRCHRRG